MSNTLIDLNNHLFSQLERLNDDRLNGEHLQQEIERSKAITDVAKSVISNASLHLDAMKLKAEYKGLERDDLPKLLGADQ